MEKQTTAFAGLVLTWDEFYWLGHIPDLGPLGKELELHVETMNEAAMLPHALQADVWKQITSAPDRYAGIIRKGLFQYYCEVRPRYEKAGPEWIADMPALTVATEIDRMLSINSIMLRWPYDGQPPSVGFSYWCQWDREHGAGIIMQGDAVLDVGGADCLYCT